MKVNELTPLLSDENIIYVSDPDRQLFIMKVYRTIWLELLYTISFISLAMVIKPINDFMTGNYGFGILFLVFNLLIIQSCSLICCMDKLRKKPYNYLYVSVYTILMSYFLFFLCYTVPPQSLLLAGTSTLFMFSGLSIYAWQTNIDYSTKGNYLLISLLLLFLLGFFNLFFQLTFIQILYPLLGVGVFSFYIIYDTQLILGRKTIKYKPDDYMIASVNIYLDIINMFIFILEMINGR
tara:strand:+ start:473 stop:1183 length:711 start_codon:yes stop_codon:yes gene_type:complete